MDNIQFSQSFRFYTFSFSRYHYTDNRAGVADHYIGYMKSGSARLVSDCEQIQLAEGDLFYIPCGCRYQSYWQGSEGSEGAESAGAEGGEESQRPAISFDSFAFRYFPERENLYFPLQKVPFGPVAEEVVRLIGLLEADLQVNCRSVGLLYQLLGLMRPYMRFGRRGAESEAVEKAVAYIRSHSDFQVSELARLCHMSESALYAAFQSAVGRTPVQTKHRILAERAVELLTSTDLPVEGISSLLGFSSAAYFRKILRRETGRTPREIRRAARL